MTARPEEKTPATQTGSRSARATMSTVGGSDGVGGDKQVEGDHELCSHHSGSGGEEGDSHSSGRESDASPTLSELSDFDLHLEDHHRVEGAAHTAVHRGDRHLGIHTHNITVAGTQTLTGNAPTSVEPEATTIASAVAAGDGAAAHSDIEAAAAAQRSILVAAAPRAAALLEQHLQQRPQHTAVADTAMAAALNAASLASTASSLSAPLVGGGAGSTVSSSNVAWKVPPQLSWKRGDVVGEGTFGKVYKGLNEATGELLAIKQLYLADGSDSEAASLGHEITLMWNLHHDNIVRYLDTAISDRYLFIIMEYVTGGSIAGMLAQYGAFAEPLIRQEDTATLW